MIRNELVREIRKHAKLIPTAKQSFNFHRVFVPLISCPPSTSKPTFLFLGFPGLCCSSSLQKALLLWCQRQSGLEAEEAEDELEDLWWPWQALPWLPADAARLREEEEELRDEEEEEEDVLKWTEEIQVGKEKEGKVGKEHTDRLKVKKAAE